MSDRLYGLKEQWKETGFLRQFWLYCRNLGKKPGFWYNLLVIPEADVLKVFFQESAVEKSDRSQPDRILDDDKYENLVKIEILNAQERVANPQMVEYSVILPNSQPIETPVAEEQEPLSLTDRRAFMQLLLAERRRILAKQAEVMEALQSTALALVSIRSP